MILTENEKGQSSIKEFKQGKEADYEGTIYAVITEAKRVMKAPKKTIKKDSTEATIRPMRVVGDRKEQSKLQSKQSNGSNSRKRSEAPGKAVTAENRIHSDKKIENVKVMTGPLSDASDGAAEEVLEEKVGEEYKDIDNSDEAPCCDRSAETDDETIDTEENSLDEDKLNPHKKIEEMEIRIEKLEEELREVAALELFLYSVVSEHGSSTNKVHTPARHLSRLYIYAHNHWSQDKRATITKNMASGLVLVANSCGNDAARLTFWLSNLIVLREIISLALGSSFPMGVTHPDRVVHISEEHTSQQRNTSFYANKASSGFEILRGVEDWEESSTFAAVLERIESWIFSRIVESIWQQTLAPPMQVPVEDMCKRKGCGKLSGPALGDQGQGPYSIDLWKDAFLDAFNRLCPVRAEGIECGCLPILARMVMEKCVSRLDVAMFNAILRESANQIPTDPVSDPIVDSRILPITAGDLSFGSGAQLKNAIGYWSRWLSDLFGIDMDDSIENKEVDKENDYLHDEHAEFKGFLLLNSLSDLLMLPKEMLLEESVRQEVCPSISLPLIIRILCNFTPDEFCPDHVPCAILEDLNSENLLERQTIGNKSTPGFPYTALPLVYCPPSAADIAKKVGDARAEADVGRKASMVQSRGMSNEDIDDLHSPLTSIVDWTPPISPASGDRNGNGGMSSIIRFELLREVWYA